MASMSKKKSKSKKKPSRLGHDPLDFLDEDETLDESGLSEAVTPQLDENIQPADEKLAAEFLLDDTSVDEETIEKIVTSEATNEEVEVDDVIDIDTEVENPERLILPSNFTIYEVMDVDIQMKAILDSGCSSIELLGGDVESIDAAALQLLVSFLQQTRETGKNFNWKSCSDKIKEVADNLSIKL